MILAHKYLHICHVEHAYATWSSAKSMGFHQRFWCEYLVHHIYIIQGVYRSEATNLCNSSHCLHHCRARIDVKPPDLLWVEWFSGKGTHTTSNIRRQMAAYKYNLLEHMGKVSSFTVRVDRPNFPRCYESMADVWSLSKAERFQVRLVSKQLQER